MLWYRITPIICRSVGKRKSINGKAWNWTLADLVGRAKDFLGPDRYSTDFPHSPAAYGIPNSSDGPDCIFARLRRCVECSIAAYGLD
jgi:hypothetical protein